MSKLLSPIRAGCMFASIAAFLTLALACAAASALAGTPEASADALRSKYTALGPQLLHNPFGRALVLESAETSGQSSGDIYALMEYPFATANAALKAPDHWCDILILHLNTKYCGLTTAGSKTTLTLFIGKKFDQPLADANRVDLDFRAAAGAPGYFAIVLYAEDGPMGTSNYRIDLEAIPLGETRTFLHFRYAYEYGMFGRMAMQAYLATAGRSKVGFTVVGQGSGGEPNTIGGVRGVVERNTMRYYLAIDAYLAAPGTDQLDNRFQRWFDSTERYRRQLHELDAAEYLEMKRNEYARQQLPPPK